MSTLVINKKSLKTWLHTDSVLGSFIISKFYFNADGLNFQVVEQGQSKRVIYNVADITIIDDTDGGASFGPYGSITELSLKLEELKYPAFYVDGSFNSITGLIEAGTNVMVTGSGTEGDPYVISSTGGGGGAVTSVNGSTGAVVLGLTEILTESEVAEVISDERQYRTAYVFGTTYTELTQNYNNIYASSTIDDDKTFLTANEGTGQIAGRTKSTGESVDIIIEQPTGNGSITFPDVVNGNEVVAMMSDITGVSDGDKGDITVSSAGTVWTIDNGAVTDAKVATGIDAVKIASGVVSNTEFELLNGVTGVIANQAYADAKVADAITDGVTTIAPSQNAVFDALDLKQNKPDYMKLTSAYTLASSTALQKLFNVGSGSGGAYNASANRTIRFELEFELTGLSSSSGDFKFGVIGTAGIASINYKALSAKSANLDAQNTPFFVSSSVATATSLSASTTVTTAKAMIHGTIVTSTAGTIILAVATGVATGACQVGINSFAIFEDIGADTLGATSNIS